MILTVSPSASLPLRTGSALDEDCASLVRRRAQMEGCKWDPQVGDESTLMTFPLILKSSAWKEIATAAERLTREAEAAEAEVGRRPELLDALGLPQDLRRALAERSDLSPTAARVMRFDFHYTTDSWRISEANSDVPGGFSEASHFTSMIAEYFPELVPSGDPAAAWCDALAEKADASLPIALLSAPGYMEDHQVVAFLASRLHRRGFRTFLAKPDQIGWRSGTAFLEAAWYRGRLGSLVRFYQAEWLAKLPRSIGWNFFFRGGKTPVANPPLAIVSESKRFPLIWDKLSTPLPTWRAFLPETREPRDAPSRWKEGWLLKTAFCNTGDTVSVREWMRPADWRWTALEAWLKPGEWIAQRRFESIPLMTPAGPRHACLGVYTVNGKAAGAYARLSKKPLIDFEATDVALLIEKDD